MGGKISEVRVLKVIPFSVSSTLISGSDDVQIIIWDAVGHRKIKTIETSHEGNIFSVKYVPHTNNSKIASGAADCKVRVTDVVEEKEVFSCKCHRSRIKRLATSQQIPSLFWSSSEDGLILEYDLRSPHTCSGVPSNCLINLCTHMGFTAEAKCIAINPLRSELIAVGTNDPFIRLFDRRMISKCPKETKPTSDYQAMSRTTAERLQHEPILTSACATFFVPGHLPHRRPDLRTKLACKSLACTYVAFSPNGSELLANLGGEQVYLFDTFKRTPHKSFCINFKANGFCSAVAPDNPIVNLKLTPQAEELKIRANVEYEMKHYSRAIKLYNEAIALYPRGAVLYNNRASAYLQRRWDGDLYAALRDCYTALSIEHDYMKVHLKLVKILLDLKWESEAVAAFESFKIRYPEKASSPTGQELEKRIQDSSKSNTKNEEEDLETVLNSDGASSPRLETDDEDDDSLNEFPGAPNIVVLSEEEKLWRKCANDFKKRFCGHCNTTTDIKEANFFGR